MAITQDTWASRVRSVVIHVTDFLSFDGQDLPGGRQRLVGDLALAIRELWDRDVLIVQKATRPFVHPWRSGIRISGIACRTDSLGDPYFGWQTWHSARADVGLIYASGEDAWPFLVRDNKTVQHGIWWDGPYGFLKRYLQRIRVFASMEAARSVLCVDTNFVNWLRTFGRRGHLLANKCVYVPNYADLSRVPVVMPTQKTNGLRILFARRFEVKRGAALFLDALRCAKAAGLEARAIIFTIGGRESLAAEIAARGIGDLVEVRQASLEAILGEYRDVDFAIVPSLWSEGTSFACVEALCAGLPVVATPVGGLGNLVVPYFNGLLVEPTPSAVAGAIMELRDPALRARLSGNCLAMREALSLETWRRRILGWVTS